MDRYICLHGHFYQPPRENPWLEEIELQDSAYPFHDWNERITAECYDANAGSRILDDSGRIRDIVNNYSRISFNFGPTLLSWLEEHQSEVYRAILAADAHSRERYLGHGSALAQAYNHMILPLANSRDKRCQLVWGLRDFEHRFGRKAEGLWLPETAVDVETLEMLADLDLRFTVLAPHQAGRVRQKGARRWRDVRGGNVDPTTAYEIPLPSGRRLCVFFYDGPISRAVAFEGLLQSGEKFVHRLLDAFAEGRDWPQLAHIATDGETYGHHHRHGDMALAYALHYVEANGLAKLTNYGAYLESHPPTWEAQIVENSSWSCIHGIERWRSDCGCNSGGHPGWSQAWRAPLREALDALRDRLAPLFEAGAGEFLGDPWKAREDYVDVILDRSTDNLERFLSRHATRQLSPDERIRVCKLLELQRHAMLMYTSCGWFFDELSGIETVQVIQYAGRAVQLARELFEEDPEPAFLEALAKAHSNIPEHGDGRDVYDKFVRPAMVDLHKVAAHYAVSHVFDPYESPAEIYGFRVTREDERTTQAGRATLAVGRMRVESTITGQSDALSYGVLHFGDQNLSAGVRRFQDDEAYGAMVEEVTKAFSAGDLTEVVRLLGQHFGELTYSLKSLFRDQQRRILESILQSTLDEATAMYRQLHENHAPLMRFLGELGMPLPSAFRASAELVLNSRLREAMETLDVERIRRALDEVGQEKVPLDREGLAFTFKRSLDAEMNRFVEDHSDGERLRNLRAAADLATALPFEVDLSHVQNLYFRLLRSGYAQIRSRAEGGDDEARTWVRDFEAFGESLHIRVHE